MTHNHSGKGMRKVGNLKHIWGHIRLSCPRQLLHILSVFSVALTPDSQAPAPLRPD